MNHRTTVVFEVFSILVLMLLLVIPIHEASFYRSFDAQNKCPGQTGFSVIYAGGKSTLMGCSSGVHLSPLWFQVNAQWISYGFEGPTVLLINGIPTFHSEPVRLYMENFKGIAPGSLQWRLKSGIGARIRVLGICSYYELHG